MQNYVKNKYFKQNKTVKTNKQIIKETIYYLRIIILNIILLYI